MPVLFDGVDDVINFGVQGGAAGSVMVTGTTMSIVAWAYPISIGTNAKFVHRQTGSSGVAFGINAGQASFRVGGATALLRIANNSTVTTGTWNHFAVTWTGATAATTAKIYINAVEVGYGTSTSGATFNANSTATVLMGLPGITGGTGSCWNGYIDEIAIWKSVLTQANITQLYTSRVRYTPAMISPSTLTFYAPLNEYPDGVSMGGSTVFTCVGTVGTGGRGANASGLTGYAGQILTNRISPRRVLRGNPATLGVEGFGRNPFGQKKDGRFKWGTPRWYQ